MMNSVMPINNMLLRDNYKFRYKFVLRKVYIKKSDKEINVYTLVILFKNIKKNVEVINGTFTNYFIENYRNSKPNNSKRVANLIVQFLNYLYFECNLKDFSKLSLEHGTDFLNEFSKNNLEDVVLRSEAELRKFYKHYIGNNVITQVSNEDISVDSPFLNVNYNNKQKSEKLQDMNALLVMLLLNIAIRETPSIALGVYFQFFGGLRYSECLNLTWKDITPIGLDGENGFVLDINLNDMRPDLATGALIGVKRARTQAVFSCNDLQIKLFKLHKKYKSKTDVDAVFINRDGRPMSQSSYRRHFDNLKIKFLEELDAYSEKELDGKLLSKADIISQLKWSTHIGRGFFSNMAASISKTIEEVALLRGDLSYNSSMPYMQRSQKTKSDINKILTQSYEELCDGEQYERLMEDFKKKVNIK